MSDPVETFLDSQRPMLKIVNEILDGWKGEGCFQIPQLLLSVGARLNWNSIQLRNNDPIVRAYLRDHPMWYVTRGAHGGIMPRAEHDKRETNKAAKEEAKRSLKATLEAKATQASVAVPVDGQDDTNV